MAGTPEMIKKVNMNLIYQALIEVPSATRQELSEKTNISLTTIRAVLEELLARQQIVETQLDESSGGRRAQRYALNPQKNLFLSLCVGRTSLTYQIINLNREILETDVESIEDMDITDCITNLIEKHIKKHSISAVGIGVPGIVEKGKVYLGCELNGLEVNDIGGIIGAKYNIPVVLENDLNAIAYGYATRYSRAHECPKGKVNLAYIHFNKSCSGAGFVVDGKVVHGARQFAGELGFMPIEPNQTLDKVMQSLSSFEECIDTISRTLAIISCITNPSLIVIGGDRFTGDSINPKQIEFHLKETYLAQQVCPSIVLADCYQADYMLGIKELTINHIIPLLPICI